MFRRLSLPVYFPWELSRYFIKFLSFLSLCLFVCLFVCLQPFSNFLPFIWDHFLQHALISPFRRQVCQRESVFVGPNTSLFPRNSRSLFSPGLEFPLGPPAAYAFACRDAPISLGRDVRSVTRAEPRAEFAEVQPIGTAGHPGTPAPRGAVGARPRAGGSPRRRRSFLRARSWRPVAYPFSDGRAPGSSPVFATTYEDVGTRRVILGGNVFRFVWGKARGMELLAPGYARAEPCGSPRNRVPEWFALFRPPLHPQRFSTLPDTEYCRPLQTSPLWSL